MQKIVHRHHTFLERLGDLSVSPRVGILIAFATLFIAFEAIRFIGEGLITYMLDPFFEKNWLPLILKLSSLLGTGFWHEILIGKLIIGSEDKFKEAMGLLTSGVYVPFAAILPYIFSFYLVLSFLEDCGYLPRLAVLVDSLMHKLGLHGYSIISMILGLGCNVPGVLSTRIVESRREKFISITLLAIAVPCAAQTAISVNLLGKYGAKGLFSVFLTLFLVWLLLGMLLNLFLKGEAPELFVEIPPYRVPYFRGLFKKVWLRVKLFIKDALPLVLLGIFIVNVLYAFHIIEGIAKIFSPIIVRWLGLPSEAGAALLVGILRKYIAVGILIPLNLTLKQLIIACVVLTMYFPCVASFVTIAKELGVIDMLKSTLIMIVSALAVGGLLNLILPY